MKSGRVVCVWAALLFCVATVPIAALAAEQPATQDAPPATVVQPRGFGYVLGDVVTQRVLLPDRFEPAPLTTPQRVNLWFERRAARIESTSDGRRWLVVDYQVTNAPQTLAAASVPAWTLVSNDGAKLSVAAWPMYVGALIPENTSLSVEQLRPDRPAPTIPTAALRTRLRLALLALAATLVGWLAWTQWRDWRERASLPFAHALHEMRHLSDDAPQAWQMLHRAFDQTAGRVVQLETLPALFQRAPYFQPLHMDIERFFSQSSARFFGAGLAETPVSARVLCRELKRLEKRYAR
jgi:mxaA protein